MSFFRSCCALPAGQSGRTKIVTTLSETYEQSQGSVCIGTQTWACGLFHVKERKGNPLFE